MQEFQFGTPGGGDDRLTCDEIENQRILVRPIEYIPAMMTQRGEETDAIKLNVVALQDPAGPKLYQGPLWFGGRLIKAFKRNLGVLFIGYVTKVRTPRGLPAWDFVDLQSDPETVQMATEWLRANPEFSAPLPPTQAPQASRAPFNPTGHHEQGPPPDWAGAVPAPAKLPPAPPGPPVSAPPAVGLTAQQETVLQRLARMKATGEEAPY